MKWAHASTLRKLTFVWEYALWTTVIHKTIFACEHRFVAGKACITVVMSKVHLTSWTCGWSFGFTWWCAVMNFIGWSVESFADLLIRSLCCCDCFLLTFNIIDLCNEWIVFRFKALENFLQSFDWSVINWKICSVNVEAKLLEVLGVWSK